LPATADDVASFVVVATVVTISMTLDFVQETRAHSAVEVLRATARRDGASLSAPCE
jgi:P-type Mg2+ transporter